MAEAGSLFKPFWQIKTTKSREGFGIGLATVERIIRRHGGGKALEDGLDAHERAPLIGSLLVKMMVAAGYSDNEIRLAVSTMSAYVD